MMRSVQREFQEWADWALSQADRIDTNDPRPETFRPVDSSEFEAAVAHVDTADNWRERRRLLLKTARVYDKLDDLIAGAKANQVSLAVFKPTSILDFIWEADDREWDPDKVRQMRVVLQHPP